jgi:hypothetical protein
MLRKKRRQAADRVLPFILYKRMRRQLADYGFLNVRRQAGYGILAVISAFSVTIDKRP